MQMMGDTDVRMKKPHRRLFLTEWNALVASAADMEREVEAAEPKLGATRNDELAQVLEPQRAAAAKHERFDSAERNRLDAELAEEERRAEERRREKRRLEMQQEELQLAKEQAERQRNARAQIQQETLAAEREEQEEQLAKEREELRLVKLAAKREEEERDLAQQQEALRLAQEEAEQQRLAQEEVEQQRLTAEREEEERKMAQQREEVRLEKERVERERAAAAAAAEAEAEARRAAEQKKVAEEKKRADEAAAARAAEAQKAAEMAVITSAAEKVGLKVGNNVRIIWKGEVITAEIVRYELPAGKVVGKYTDGKLYYMGDSVAAAKANVDAAVKKEWETKSAGKRIYDSHWNQKGDAKSKGTDKCIVIGPKAGDKLEVFFQDCIAQTVPAGYVIGWVEEAAVSASFLVLAACLHTPAEAQSSAPNEKRLSSTANARGRGQLAAA
eukprot:COSAG06_NODE_314_length_17706_cov_366.601940_6_plen_445_part_00